MDLENIRLEVRPPLAIVTIDRPKVLNALNYRSMAELEQVFLDIRQNPDVRAVLLTGAGEKAFVAGADISELASLTPLEGEQLATRGQRIFHLIENCGKPVIACINGFALGGGCELALACTLRIASTNARLGQPEVKIGIIPGYGGTQRLPRLIGKGAALKMILTAEMVSAAEALRLGLVDEVVAPDQLLPRAEQLAQTIARDGSPGGSRLDPGGQLRLRPTACQRSGAGGFALWLSLLYQRQARRRTGLPGKARPELERKMNHLHQPGGAHFAAIWCSPCYA